MNKFYMNGKLIHKASDHNTKRCEIEKWVFLPHSDFERLKANPYQEHEAITAARDLMYEDKNAYHCIMLLDEYGEDGLLIEAEGFDYPRLSMFVPDAKSIYERYQTSESELKLHDMIKDTVKKIAELAHADNSRTFDRLLRTKIGLFGHLKSKDFRLFKSARTGFYGTLYLRMIQTVSEQKSS